MATEGDSFSGHFHIGYDDGAAIFKAYVHDPRRNAWVPAEASPSLERLFQICKQRGLTSFDGLSQSAIERIHKWLVLERPVLQYVEGLWEGSELSKRGPIGFRPRVEEGAGDGAPETDSR